MPLVNANEAEPARESDRTILHNDGSDVNLLASGTGYGDGTLSTVAVPLSSQTTATDPISEPPPSEETPARDALFPIPQSPDTPYRVTLVTNPDSKSLPKLRVQSITMMDEYNSTSFELANLMSRQELGVLDYLRRSKTAGTPIPDTTAVSIPDTSLLDTSRIERISWPFSTSSFPHATRATPTGSDSELDYDSDDSDASEYTVKPDRQAAFQGVPVENTWFMSITAGPEYKDLSFEELRLRNHDRNLDLTPPMEVVFPHSMNHLELQASETVFRVHAYLFERESEEGKALVAQSHTSLGNERIVLEDVTATEMKIFLRLLYLKPLEGVPTLTKDEWIAVLKLSHKWGFHAFHDVAVRKLEPDLTGADRIVLGRAHAVHAWLKPGYTEICSQGRWPTDEECRRIGLEDLIKIGRVREAMRSEDVSSPAVAKLIGDTFQLRAAAILDEERSHDEGADGVIAQGAATLLEVKTEPAATEA